MRFVPQRPEGRAHAYAIGERDRFIKIMRHQYDRDAHSLAQFGKLRVKLAPRSAIDG
jgi:hypothetical protein